MANCWLNWVFDESTASGSARLMLLAIADRADAQGVAYPSIAGLAQRMGFRGEHAGRNALRVRNALIEAGELIVVSAGGGRGKLTRLLLRGGRSDVELAPIIAQAETVAPAPGFRKPKTLAPAPGFENENPGARRTKPRRTAQETPAPGAQKPGAGATRTLKNHTEPTAENAAAAGAEADGGAEAEWSASEGRRAAVAAVLEAEGVGEPKLSELAGRGDITAELVAGVVAHTNQQRGVRNRGALIVKLLESPPAEVRAELANLERRRRRAAELQRENEQLQRARAEVAAVPADAWPETAERAADWLRSRGRAEDAEELNRWGQRANKLPPAAVLAVAAVVGGEPTAAVA